MRILHIVARRQLRGAEVFASQLAAGLAERGHDVTLAGLFPPTDPDLAPAGVRALDLGGRATRIPSLRLLWSLADLLRDFEPDIVQANGSATLKAAVLANLYTRKPKPIIVYRNISVASRWLRGRLHQSFNRWLVSRVDHIVSLTNLTAEDFRIAYHVEAEKISVVPIGTEVGVSPDREAAREELARLVGEPLDGPLVVHVGSFTPEKDHLGLLAAFERVLGSLPDAHLVLIGTGPLVRRVESAAAAGAAGAAVHLLKSRPDAADLIAGADVLALSSRIEGLPGVVLEAAARGVPVVATAVGSVGEAVIDGETGLLVPPGDPVALADALVAVLTDACLARRLGAAAGRRVKEAFSIRSVVNRFEDVYLRLLAARRAGLAQGAG